MTHIANRDGMYWQADEPPFRAEPAATPIADEPCAWWETWPFVACLGVIAFGVYVARAWGLLP